MRQRRVAILALAPLLMAAERPRLVPDVSQREIQIVYSFTGAELLLFGAILYPGGRTPSEQADIAVVLEGPVEPITVREKRKIFGIWMNATAARYHSAPSYYAVASSRPLAELIDARTAAIYELGLNSLQLSPASASSPEEARRFREGLVDLRRRAGLYLEELRGVEITDGVLYRARLRIPARVPVGDYTAETFLIEDGRVLAGAVREIHIGKSGFERLVAHAAHRWSLTYGLFAVAISLLLGWVAALIFRR